MTASEGVSPYDYHSNLMRPYFPISVSSRITSDSLAPDPPYSKTPKTTAPTFTTLDLGDVAPIPLALNDVPGKLR